jgi:hypothetical protein
MSFKIVNNSTKNVKKIRFYLGILQPNSTSECYTRTNEELLNKLRSNAAKAKPHVT